MMIMYVVITVNQMRTIMSGAIMSIGITTGECKRILRPKFIG